MKKFLLGTTAVVAATAFGGAAYAQSASEPIKLGLGGYWRGAAGANIGSSGSGNNQGRLKQQFLQDSVIIVSGTTKFDNGLNVGVSVQFRGEGANSVNETLQGDLRTVRGGQDTVKRSYVRFFGDFGEVRFGDDEDARMQKSFTAPQAGSLFGVNTPFFLFSNNPVGSNSTEAPITVKRSQRLAYFSPTIAGFSFAASYSPTSQKGNLLSATGFQSTTGLTVANQQSQSWSVGALYDNKFGDFRLQAFGGLTGARTIGGGFNTTTTFSGGATTTATTVTAAGSGSNQNKFVWNGGATVGWGPLQAGATYEHISNSRLATGFSDQNDNVWDAGVVYTIGPFSTSLNYSHGSYKGFAVANATSRLDEFAIIGDYVLGPGVSIGAQVMYNRYASGVASTGSVATQNEHDWSLALGTAFTF